MKATRALFDERGMQDAPIDEIAKAVGIARGLIYRHFASKEELYVLTVTDYLDELVGRLREAIGPEDGDPVEQLQSCTAAFAEFCLHYPAFLDSSMSLMRRPARELSDVISESIWLRLGNGMAQCLDQVASIVRRGNASGDFAVEDPDWAANALWTQGLGLLHLARLGVGVRRSGAGATELFPVDAERIVRTCVANACAMVREG